MVAANEKLNLLLQSYFPELPADVIEEVRAAGRVKQYPTDTTLCRQGANEHTFYILLHGSVDVYANRLGERFIVDTLRRGSFFGEIALMLNRPRTADVVTAEPTTVLEIDRATFDRHFQSNARLMLLVVGMLVRRIDRQEERMLTELAKYRRSTDDKRRFFVSYSRADLAFVNRLVMDLKKYGVGTWLDVHMINPGESWPGKIQNGLQSCDAMIVVLSPESVKSNQVDDEWNYYLDRQKLVVPVVYQTCDIPYRLNKLHHISFVTHEYDLALTLLVGFLNSQGT